MKRVLPTIAILSLFTIASYANSSLGSEITYKKIDSSTYVVSLIKYRSCSGLPMPSTEDLLISCYSSTSGPLTTTLNRISIEEIKVFCTSYGYDCSPQNTKVTGSEGIERHVFTDTIDFSLAFFSTIANCSVNIHFSFSDCCRTPLINTGGANTTEFNFAELNLAMGNNSVDLTSDPHLKQACQQPVYHNIGAQDGMERDSLSYSFGWPLTTTGGVTFIGTYYKYFRPFQAYFPGGSVIPPIPNSSPPIGVYMNPETGDVIFTPTNCNEVTTWAIQVTEWRKDTAGVNQIVGITRRDHITSTTVVENNTPKINSPYSYNVCEGEQLCFNITTTDAPLILPPPSTTSISDTLILTWNNGIPGANFTILDSSARLKTGRFCWTPPYGSAYDNPYTFTVTVDDNHCDRIATSNRAFRIHVKQRAETNVNITSMDCGWYTLSSQLDSSTFKGSPGYEWVLLDSNSNLVFDNSVAFFQSTNNFLSFNGIDSLKIQREGKYILQHTIKNPPFNCPTNYFDTITVGKLATATIDFPNDTFICKGTDFMLNTTTTNALGYLHYQWYANNSILTNDTTTSLAVNNFDSDTTIRYKVVITDVNGCTNSDAVVINPNIPYQDTLAYHTTGCMGDTIRFSLDSSLQNVQWSNGSNAYELLVFASSNLNLSYVDTLGCIFNDSVIVNLKDLPQPVLVDSTYCGNSALVSPGFFEEYLWNTGSTMSPITISSAGTYSVQVTDSNGCKNSDTATFGFLNLVTVSLGPDTTHCGPLELSTPINGTYNWSTGSITSFTIITQSGYYTLDATDVTGCSSTDDINVVIKPLPQQSWADTIYYCSNSLVTLTSDSFSSYHWNTGATTRNIQVGNGPYAVTFTDDTRCENTDTVYAKVSAVPNFSLGTDTTFCGTTLLLSASGGSSYLWNTGGTKSTENATTSGTYWLNLTDQNGCSNTDSIDIELLMNPNIPTLTRSNTTITSNQSGTHKWFKNGSLISGITQNTLTIYGIGSYTAITIDSNGCESRISNPIEKTAGIDNLNSDEISIYPNPAKDKVTIDVSGIGKVNSIELFDSRGRNIENIQTVQGSLIDLQWTTESSILYLVIKSESGIYKSEIMSYK
ncbi:MAG: hypothetical protein COA58_04015 [Bacteroidetes bacterium]|nr:MAG: hypothetical protein COA58_04015 [Bacteroidota bacterium]